MSLKSLAVFLACSLLPISTALGMTSIYAAPGGSGNGMSASSPASLAEAVGMVRSFNATDDVTLFLRGGVYDLSSGGISLGSADGGQQGHRVIWRNYPGEKPVLSGGIPITGWADPDQDGIYTAAVTPAGYKARQFWVEGKKATRSRREMGIYNHLTKSSPYALQPLQYQITDPEFPALTYPEDLELHFSGRTSYTGMKAWKHYIYGATGAAKSGDTTTITCDPGPVTAGESNYYADEGYNPYPIMVKPNWVENALEFLNADTQGNWFLPSVDNTIYYVPRAGENMTTVEAILPHAETLIHSSDGLRNIDFVGLTFAYTGWMQPTIQDNLIETQGTVYLNKATSYRDCWDSAGAADTPAGAVEIYAAADVNFYQCTFEHLGGAGLKLGLGVDGSKVVGNTFEDIASHAIYLGSHFIEDGYWQGSDHTSYNLIRSNSIKDVGNQYIGSPAIMIGFAEYTEVLQNDISGVPYTGISVGWGWGHFADQGYSGNNDLAYNHIHDVMNHLFDGGGIYTTDWQNGTKIHDNYIYNVGNYFDTSSRELHNQYHPIYADWGTKEVEVYKNVILENSVRSGYTWLSISLDGDGSAVYDNYAEFTLDKYVYLYGGELPSPNEDANYLSSDYSLWPQTAKEIVENAGLEGILTVQLPDGTGLVFGSRPENTYAQVDGYKIISYEEPSPTTYRAHIAGVSDGFASLSVAFLAAPDSDGDGVLDSTDNCPEFSNINQTDINGNGIGDACETTPPVAETDRYDVDLGQALAVSSPGVLENDSDSYGNPLIAVLVDGPAHFNGFNLDADGSFNYQHDGTFSGNDSFTYMVDNGLTLSDPVSVNLTLHTKSEVDQDLSLSPDRHLFGVEDLNDCSSSTPVIFTLKNSGSEPRDIGSIAFSGYDASQYALSADLCSGTSLPANSSCTLEVKFCPTSVGSKAATLLIPSDDPETPTLAAMLFNHEGLSETAWRRLPPVLENLSLPETMTAGQTYTLTWSMLGYDTGYLSNIAFFDCTGVPEGNCGSSYGSRFEASGNLPAESIEPGGWNYLGVQAKRFNYSYTFIAPQVTEPTDMVIRFYRKSESDAAAGLGGLSLLLPGNLGEIYYDSEGRRLLKPIVP